MPHTGSPLVRVILNNSLLLIAGTALAIVWANVDFDGYDHVVHPIHFWVNDVGMAFFFALAAKEVFEATLPGGALSSPRQASVPLAAAAGGMVVPAAIYIGLVTIFGPSELGRGWAIPCATDIAFSAMVARLIFGKGHPAVAFLLLLAIADDAMGLIILALFYPSGELSPLALMTLMAAAVASAFWFRRRKVASFWPYVLISGGLSWTALYLGGFHPALALVPVIPFMPHAPRDLGVDDPAEEHQPDTLNRFEHWWAIPVQCVLFFFGLANAGVPFTSIGAGTWFVVAALLIGKPAGIVAFAAAARRAGGSLAPGLDMRDLVVLGCVASIGFTVSLFFATAAFSEGAALAETKMGALLSFAGAPLAALAAFLLRRRGAAMRV